MNTDSTLIATRIASLPMTSAERREALAYVRSGETLAGICQAIVKWLEGPPSLKPSY